ncbi:cytochrome b6-f complex subunit 7 [Phtheirospermum japonicum]|uniref:Cytochrome b6-f complex subunit 7 n=1 Tax=Phtheirospermum japonicum TaxID=374723 RepID=A0A830D6J2_9LAMI|nr:cytochrome b6-f complex subunit 7 [Phtheirospermum japonicum]
MAASSATISPATVLAASTVVGPTRSSQGRTKINYINGLNSFGGLKATNNVATLGLPVCTEQSFAKIVGSLKKPSSQNKKGGAFTSTCSTAIDEIFKIAAILPGLVLIGVAVGFVLLRIEATIEEEGN